jgi:hypothetical protein
LTIVNLSGSPIPLAAMRPLQDAMSSHANHFVEAQQGRTFLLSQHVRLAREGVFVRDQKVVGLDQMLEKIARAEVTTITSVVNERSVPWAIGGASAGAVGGLYSFAWIGLTPCRGSCSNEGALMGLALIGLPILGGVLGYQLGAHDVQRLVYRAP